MARYFLSIIILVLLIGPAAMPKKTALKLKAPVESKGKKGNRPEIGPLEGDSLEFSGLIGEISFSGFDKPASSRRETFLISNSSGQHLKGVEVRILYRDPEGRMLHSREEKIMIDIPAGETRQADIRSFDTQQTYYYRLSRPPKRSAAQPFDVEITPIRIFLPR